MTYKKNFVCAIKVDGKVLRESSDQVELPFGAEYSVLLKNLDSVRMQARISVDGKDATGWLVIAPGQSVDVERFVENLDQGNRFKFIERSEAVEAHRGIKAEDGLVRVEFKREKIYPITYTYSYPYYTYIHPLYVPFQGQITCNSVNVSGNVSSQSGDVTRSASGGQIGALCMNIASAGAPAQVTMD
jgi:hypothetical protein